MVWICICMIWCPINVLCMDMHMYGCSINVLWYGYAYVWYDAPLMYYGACDMHMYGYDAPLMYYGMDMHMYDMMPH